MKIELDFITEVRAPAEGCDIQVLLPAGPAADEGYLQHCRAHAHAAHVPLVTALFEADGMLQMAYIDDAQTVLQPACFLREEDEGRYAKGTDIEIIDTRFGRLALCAGIDCLQPQYARLAKLRGAVLLFCCLYPGGDKVLRMQGPWSNTQANCLPHAVAEKHSGSLILPCAMTADQSGLGRLGFDTDELPAAYHAFPVLDSLNPALYKRYWKELLR